MKGLLFWCTFETIRVFLFRPLYGVKRLPDSSQASNEATVYRHRDRYPGGFIGFIRHGMRVCDELLLDDIFKNVVRYGFIPLSGPASGPVRCPVH